MLSNPSGWRCVMVAPPTVLAGIGAVLRRAFLIDGAARAAEDFQELLNNLDALDPPAPERPVAPPQ